MAIIPTIFLVDRCALTRHALTVYLVQKLRLEVIENTGNVEYAAELAGKERPDIVLMIHSGQESAVTWLTKRIKQSIPAVGTLCLYWGKGPSLSELIGAGVDAILDINTSDADLLEAVHTVIDGEKWFPPALSDSTLASFAAKADCGSSSLNGLTAREQQVVKLLSEGFVTKEVAVQLDVSVKTIHAHRNHIFHKLKIKSIAELTHFALRTGITTLMDAK